MVAGEALHIIEDSTTVLAGGLCPPTRTLLVSIKLNITSFSTTISIVKECALWII